MKKSVLFLSIYLFGANLICSDANRPVNMDPADDDAQDEPLVEPEEIERQATQPLSDDEKDAPSDMRGRALDIAEIPDDSDDEPQNEAERAMNLFLQLSNRWRNSHTNAAKQVILTQIQELRSQINQIDHMNLWRLINAFLRDPR